jgi:hypothetical protein
MDETNIPFSHAPHETIDVRGARSIDVLRSKDAKKSASACLTVTMDGQKMKPFVIFAGSSTGRIVRTINKPGEKDACDERGKYGIQPEAFMDTEQIRRWIKLVWKPFVQEKSKRPKSWDLMMGTLSLS